MSHKISKDLIIKKETKNNKNIILLIDWGTTNFRAYKYDLRKKKVINKINNNKGLLNLKRKSDFVDILYQTLLKFKLSTNQFILMAGMVGSKKGLYEVPYVKTPTNFKNLSKKIVTKSIQGIHVNIIPGLVFKKKNYYDVLRGEETLALGAIEILNIKENCYLCCPGTHSKWISIKNNLIYSFTTYMTGDLYSAIISNTILSQSLKAESEKFSITFFKQGLEFIKKNKSFTSILFKIRTMDLFKQNNSFERKSFLSGLVIGLEVFEISKKIYLSKSPLILISNGPLTKLYELSFKYCKIKYKLVNSDECFISGMKKKYDYTN